MKPMDMDMYALTELHNFIRQNATPPIMTDGIQKESKRATRKPERMPNCQIGPLFPARRKGKKMDDYRGAIAAAMWENYCAYIVLEDRNG
jgi:hypothetical protein